MMNEVMRTMLAHRSVRRYQEKALPEGLLEELVADFDGTLLLVSHDREFLDNVTTSTLVLEGEGRITETVGGYSDWARVSRKVGLADDKPKGRKEKIDQPGAGKVENAGRSRRLTWKESRRS